MTANGKPPRTSAPGSGITMHVFRAHLLSADERLTHAGDRFLTLVLGSSAGFLLWLVLGPHLAGSGQFDRYGSLVAFALVLPAGVLTVVAIVRPRAIWSRLVLEPAPLAILHPDWLELHVPGTVIRCLAWGEVAALRVRDSKRGLGEVIGPSGEPVAQLPSGLVTGNWASLAQVIVRFKPERYALGNKVRGWKALEFSLRTIPDH